MSTKKNKTEEKQKLSFKMRIKESESYDKIKKNSYVLGAMVKKNFKAQYRGSILGALWTVLNPLLNMLVLSFVFSNLFGNRNGVGSYPIYLLCGNIIFNVLRQVSAQSLSCLVSNSGLIKKTKLSYSVFPISNTFTALVNFAFSFVSLILVMLIVGQQFHWTIVLTITIIPAVTLFSLGVGFFLASLYVFFRDVKHLYSVGMTLWQYLTPIFYTASALSEPARKIVELNPMTIYVTAFRNIIQWGVVPTSIDFLLMYAWAIGLALFGYFVFKLNQRRYILYI